MNTEETDKNFVSEDEFWETMEAGYAHDAYLEDFLEIGQIRENTNKTAQTGELADPRALVTPDLQSLLTNSHLTNNLSFFKQYEETLQRIKIASEIEVNNKTVVVKKQARKEMEERLKMLKQKFTKSLTEVQSHYDEIRMTLVKKDMEIERLNAIMHEQDNLVYSYRMRDEWERKPGLKSRGMGVELINKAEEDMELMRENTSLKNQMDTVSEIVELYKEDNIAAEVEIKIIEEKIAEAMKQHNEEKQVMIQKSEEALSDLNEKYQKLQNKFIKYQYESKKEVQMRGVITHRQTELLKVLREELRSAKIVLNTPRLRHKLLEKVRSSSQSPDKSLSGAYTPSESSLRSDLPQLRSKNSTVRL
jgi:hypothetical protein